MNIFNFYKNMLQVFFPKPKKKWVGSIYAMFTSEDKFQYKFWFQLFEDSNGNRSYEVTGNPPAYITKPEAHPRFSGSVYKWLKGASLIYVWRNIDEFDYDYWKSQGMDVDNPPGQNKVIHTEMPKPDKKNVPEFKLLTFPSPENNEEKKIE